MDFLNAMNDNRRVAVRHTTSSFETKPFMSRKSATAAAAVAESPSSVETEEQRFERILLRGEFKPLKDVFNNLGKDSAMMTTALITTNSYQMFLGKLGYRIEIVKQIHEQ